LVIHIVIFHLKFIHCFRIKEFFGNVEEGEIKVIISKVSMEIFSAISTIVEWSGRHLTPAGKEERARHHRRMSWGLGNTRGKQVPVAQ